MARENTQVVNFSPNNTMTGAAVLTSQWFQCGQLTLASFLASWTGTPNGAFSFEVSNDPTDNPGTIPAAGIIPLPLPAAFAAGNPAGSATGYPFDFEIAFRWIRIKYTNASSTGALFAFFEGKGSA